jgi:hypothetical protein
MNEMSHLARDVSALSNARTKKVAENRVVARAFDKAVRSKPLARRTRALWKLNGAGEGVEVRWSRQDDGLPCRSIELRQAVWEMQGI